jgi:hypothetical protein
MINQGLMHSHDPSRMCAICAAMLRGLLRGFLIFAAAYSAAIPPAPKYFFVQSSPQEPDGWTNAVLTRWPFWSSSEIPHLLAEMSMAFFARSVIRVVS